jgi:hypothetical protein
MYWKARFTFSMETKNTFWQKGIAFISIPAFPIEAKEWGINPPRP